jgi:thioesterase domain-containing protein
MRTMMKGFVAPRDALELRIAQICDEVLGKWIGVKDALFEDVGDLATAKAVLNAVEEQFDTALPLSTFQKAPTIAAIACCLRPRLKRLITEPLVALQPKGSKRPLFFLPGGDGNVFNFHDLARRLTPDQPFYGLQTRGLYGEEPPLDRVEEMAAAHVEAIRAVQPHGPYLLGGHCTGAFIALEMALQLERRGERVALLAAIDALAPSMFYGYAQKEDFLSPIDFYLLIARGFTDWFGREMPIKRAALLSLEPGQRAAHFMALARGIDVYPEDAGDDCVDHVLDIYHSITLNSYTPEGVISGRIALLRGRESFFCAPATGRWGGWEGLSREPIRVHEIPGNHVTVVTEPNAGLLSQKLREEIAEVGVS